MKPYVDVGAAPRKLFVNEKPLGKFFAHEMVMALILDILAKARGLSMRLIYDLVDVLNPVWEVCLG